MALLYEYTNEHSKAKTLKPVGDGIINVVSDFQWTTSNNRGETPHAHFIEYQQNSGQLIGSLIYYIKQLADHPRKNRNPYESLYFAKSTNFQYIFPYLSSKKHDRSNTFGFDEATSVQGMGSAVTGAIPTKGKIGGRIGAVTSIIGALWKGGLFLLDSSVPGKIGIEYAKTWQNTKEGTVALSFDLINTFKNVDEIRKNRELAFILTYQNSPYKRNFGLTDPPCIYDIYIPDIISLPAAYISSLSITNLGNTRKIKLDGVDRVIPEAYRFDILATSLISVSRNIFYGVETGRREILAITNGKPLDEYTFKTFPGLALSLGPHLWTLDAMAGESEFIDMIYEFLTEINPDPDTEPDP